MALFFPPSSQPHCAGLPPPHNLVHSGSGAIKSGGISHALQSVILSSTRAHAHTHVHSHTHTPDLAAQPDSSYKQWHLRRRGGSVLTFECSWFSLLAARHPKSKQLKLFQCQPYKKLHFLINRCESLGRLSLLR